MATTGLPGSAPAVAAPGQVQTDLQVLVISDPAYTGPLEDRMTVEGVPFTRVVLGESGRPTIDAGFLADTSGSVPRAKFQGVILPNAGGGTLSTAEMAALDTYSATYGIRQVSAYNFPNALIGLDAPTLSGSLDGKTAQVTPAGLVSPFAYLDGPVPFDDIDTTVDESYGYLAPVLENLEAGTTVEPLVTADSGVIVGVHRNTAREQLFLTFTANSGQTQMRLLAPGIIEWLTAGVHLGLLRNNLSVHVDDILNEDARWDPVRNCTPGEDCPVDDPATEAVETEIPIRMTPADVASLTAWQAANGLVLDMAFNGRPSVTLDGTTLPPTAKAEPTANSLTAALFDASGKLRWINHTYDHVYFGCVQEPEPPWDCVEPPSYVDSGLIQSDISDNLKWANQYGLELDSTELVTGEHSGLADISPGRVQEDNPAFIEALVSLGIKVVASDASKEPQQRAIGGALTLPRYPNSLYYNVSTTAEIVDEYNWIYGPKTDSSGEGNCTAIENVTTCLPELLGPSGFESYIAPFEARQTLGRVLNNDPRPHFTHQSNIAGDKLVYTWLDQVAAKYAQIFATNTPIIQPSMTEAADVLAHQASWNATKGSVTAYTRGGELTITQGPAGGWVPISAASGTVTGTSTKWGEDYLGTRSAWQYLAAGESLKIDVAPNSTPTATFDVDASADPAVTVTSTSTDADGTIMSYLWDFGDGTTSTLGPQASHTYTSRGEFTITLTVTDNRAGTSAPATQKISIANVNAKPEAVIDVSCTDLTCLVDGSSSSDPENDALTYAWTFGDGTQATGVTPAEHVYPVAGEYVITLVVTDDRGAPSDPATQTVTVSAPHRNKSPKASFTATCAGLACGFDASGSSDPDGTISGYSWAFGDGTTGNGVNPLGHVFPGDGSYSVTLTVWDNEQAAATATQAVSVSAPEADAPALITKAKAKVRVKAVSARSKLKVNVNPNMGKRYWKFKVQHLKKNGNWATYKKVYKTRTRKETRTLNLKKGTYRVKVLPKFGYEGAKSKTVKLKR